ncbi:MAG: efflux RND transporter periplasmic adaptor subunit [Desulfosarcinaceae bacterium]|nr:efflux RND transporter periplasmic adaptor subunit [Desulfosarcinaceae bacterium]
MMNRDWIYVLIIFLVGVLWCLPQPAAAEPLQGITAPNADVTLSFVVAGRVDEILVEPGIRVEKNQPLVHLFDEPEQIQVRQLRALSEDRTKILAAEAELAQKQVDLKKLQRAKAKGAASVWEVEHLHLNVRIAELALRSAKLEQEQYRRQYDHARSQLSRMHLLAPIDGLVEEVNVAAGESIGTLGPVLRIVQKDPLWIDVPVPLTRARDLELGQEAWVSFPEEAAETQTPNGKIINISAVSDAASETLRIRVEVPNPQQRPAGERVMVAFSLADSETPPSTPAPGGE